MTLNELIALADKAYPDSMIERYWDAKKQRVRRNNFGDTLAQFIVGELSDTFDDDNSDEEQLKEAIRVMESAQREIGGVISALETKREG